jgi:lysophospholipase L1-like esterase
LLLLGAAEILVRVVERDVSPASTLQQGDELFRAAYPVRHDAMLGWTPRPTSSSRRNVWGTVVTIGPDGLRSNGGPPPAGPGGLVLAVGDSFTFGDQVSDSETWPALLEQRSGLQVLNAGVFGYGLDQTVLRLERLLATHRPSVVVLGLIPHDIYRCQLSRLMGAAKPYFAMDPQGRLVLRNVPVPPPASTGPGRLRLVLSRSRLVGAVMMRVAPSYWLRGTEAAQVEHRDGLHVACGLLSRAEALTAAAGARLVVLVQYTRQELDEDPGQIAYLRRCVDEPPARLVDLRPELLALADSDPELLESLFDGHMTAAGNRLVAARLAGVLAEIRAETAPAPAG